MCPSDLPEIELDTHGLEDHSEELDELSEQEVQIRFYQAMAAIQENEPRLVQRLTEAIASVLFDFCAIALVRTTNDRAVILAAAHDSNPSIGDRIAPCLESTPSFVHHVLQGVVDRGELLFHPAARGLSIAHPRDDAAPLEVRSLMVVPMRTQQGEVFGAIALGRHATHRPYDRADRALLEWISAHVSMKLETARLYRALRRSNSALSSKNEELAAAVRARDVFLATASHELKTPLSTLSLQIEIVRRTLERDRDAAIRQLPESLDTLDRQVDRLSRLVTQLLDVSRLVEDRMEFEYEELDLCAIVREVAARFEASAERRGCAITLHIPDRIPGTWDRLRLDQILSNLVSNALKYGGGTDVTVSLSHDASTVCLCVSDSGIGIPADARARIFERFERVASQPGAEGGIGLGLWIVRQIVDRFEGTIEVEGGVGQGSTFRVTLPRRPAPSAPGP